MLRKYETLYLLRPDSPQEKTDAAIARFRDIVTAGGGMIVKEENWGKKKLAFEVKKNAKGIYILLTYVAEPSLITEIERNLKIHGEVMRYLTVVLSQKVDLEAEKAERERWLEHLANAPATPPAEAEDDDDDKDEDDDDRRPPKKRRRDDDDDDDDDDEKGEGKDEDDEDEDKD